MVSCSTRGWISGPVCMQLAPLPMMATRLPVRSTSSRQRAVWNDGPANESRPSICGYFSGLKMPVALISTVVRSISVVPSPRRTSTCHPWVSAS